VDRIRIQQLFSLLAAAAFLNDHQDHSRKPYKALCSILDDEACAKIAMITSTVGILGCGFPWLPFLAEGLLMYVPSL
jgi:hypothetical protein